MDFLKTLWPTPFKIKPKDVGSFIVQLIVFALIIIVASVLIGFLAQFKVIGWIFGIIGSLIDLYSLVGVILCICKFLDVLK